MSDNCSGEENTKEEGVWLNIIFLLVIYLAFVSLGLPDTLLGSAWPVMQGELGVSLDAQGLITVTVSCATIFSCLMTERIVRHLGTALWTPSYLVGFRSFSPDSAAQTTSAFYFCVMMGGLCAGFCLKSSQTRRCFGLESDFALQEPSA